MLVFLIKLLSQLIMAIGGFIIIKKITASDIKLFSFRTILLICLLTLVTSLLYKANYTFDRTVVMWIANIICYSYVFKINYMRSLIVNFILIFSLFISEALCLLVVNVTALDLITIRESDFIMSIFSVITIVGAYLIVKMPFLNKVFLKINEWAETQYRLGVIVFIMISIIGLSSIFNKFYLSFGNNAEFYINILICAIFMMGILFFIMEKVKIQSIEKEFDTMIKYIETLEKWMDELRIERHENKNQLLTIKSMIKHNDKKLIIFVDSLLNEAHPIDNLWVDKLNKIPSGGLKGLLYYKLANMKEFNINTDISISENLSLIFFEKMNIEDYKGLCKLLGVFVDNAIEAAKETSKKRIGLEFYKENSDVVIKVSNSFNGELDINKILSKNFSTKGKNRGYGLRLAKKIIENSKNFTEEKVVINDFYVQTLKIKIES